MDSVMARTAAELRSGCAEKKIKSLRKMLAQTVAKRRMMPAWAMMAVPRIAALASGGDDDVNDADNAFYHHRAYQ